MSYYRHIWFVLQRHRALSVCLFVGSLIFICRSLTGRSKSADIPRTNTGVTSYIKFAKNDQDCHCTDPETNEPHQFCYSPAAGKSRIKKFDCSHLKYLKKLSLLNQQQYDEKPNLSNRQIFATGASSNHFAELTDHIGSLIEHYAWQANTRIIVYDFGLDEKQAALVSSTCLVEYRKFNFSNYPSDVRQLTNYRWKPLVIAELFTEFEAFWWADSSIRWSAENLTNVYEAVSKQQLSPYLLVDSTGHSVVAATNPGMFTYLPSDKSKLVKAEMYGGGFAFVARTKQTAAILKWYVLCALEPACMDPPQSTVRCRWVNGDRWNVYAECHRYDQSAINIILANIFDSNSHRYTTRDIPEFGRVIRGSVGRYRLKPCS